MVSVIIPVYNGERYLEDCVQSVLTQTCRDLELLIVDDGSGDSTWDLCRKLAERDGRIRLFHQENAGVSAARNLGLEKARGKYILFVDADDLLMPNAVQILRDTAEAGADFVMGAHELFRGCCRRKAGHTPCCLTAPLTAQAERIQEIAPLVCGQLYRSSILRENRLRFSEGLPYGEDTVFNLQFFRFAQKGAVLRDTVYRRRKGGMASTLRYYPNRDEIALILIRAYRSGCSDREILRSVVEKELLDTVSHYLIHCSPRQAEVHVERFLRSIRREEPSAALPQTAKQAIRIAWKENGMQILWRKCRRRCYKIRKKAGM